MERFVQIHMLTHYPPSNPNRDDLGRPKSAMMGGALRLRISSQSLKRAWRTSEVFQEAMGGASGVRTKELHKHVLRRLDAAGWSGKASAACATSIAKVFGDVETTKKGEIESKTLVFISPKEWEAAMTLADQLAADQREPEEEELALLREKTEALDIALFGRMLAAEPRYNVEAAAQVAHAVSVHRVAVEDDFFTAVDDLNTGVEDVGAGHMGETEFGAALHYLYLCIDTHLLTENLRGDADLASRGLGALVKAMATTVPSGKQKSFGNGVRASYVLAERGPEQPRNLSVAFLKPVSGNDIRSEAVKLLTETRDNMGKVYGDLPAAETMNAATGEGSLQAIIDFVRGD